MLLSDFIRSIISDIRESNATTDETLINEFISQCDEVDGVYVPKTAKIQIGDKVVEIPKYLFRNSDVLAPTETELELETDICIEQENGQEPKIVVNLKKGLDVKSSHVKIKMKMEQTSAPEAYGRLFDSMLAKVKK